MAWQKGKASSTEYGSIIRYENQHYIFLDMQTLVSLDNNFEYGVIMSDIFNYNPTVEVWCWDEPIERKNGSDIISSFLYLAQKLLDIAP